MELLNRDQVKSIEKSLMYLVMKKTGDFIVEYEKKYHKFIELPTFDKLFEEYNYSYTVPGYFGGWGFSIDTSNNKFIIDASLSSRMGDFTETYFIDSNGNITEYR
jgi:hypothetical protein